MLAMMRPDEAPCATGSPAQYAGFASVGPLSLPPLVERLAPREREIAAIVHHGVEVSAEEIRGLIAKPISNSAVRTILTRLAGKGVIARRRIGRKFVYIPAQPSNGMREAAFQRLAQDYFDGSLLETALTLLTLLDERQPGAIGDIGRYLLDVQHARKMLVHGGSRHVRTRPKGDRRIVEARAGIEPACKDLQSSA